jgi:uncharacterized LabA/DUF88 family protein
MRLHEDSQFVWDTGFLYHTLWTVPKEESGFGNSVPIISRAVYVTSMVGNEDKLHEARAYIRETSFEPIVIPEEKDNEAQRAARLKDDKLLIKAKGVDIALACRVMEDAQRDLFDDCFLFTSDADYLPLIEAVRRMGKNAWVLGYEKDFTKRNPGFNYVPDRYFDLEKTLALTSVYNLSGT